MASAVELGLIYALVALGVYITFRILDFPDLTVDGSFTTGAGTAAIWMASGGNPWIGTIVAFFVGSLAGLITGLLHTKGGINGLLAGIITMIGLWSINLRIMQRSNISLLGEDTIFTPLENERLMGTWASVGILAVTVLAIKFILDYFLKTNVGTALQATGDNEGMIRSLGVNTDNMKILGLMISNGLVGLAGAIFAQYNGSADISMGVGIIVAGLASVILGQAILGTRSIFWATLGVVVGAILYRLFISWALNIGLNVNDMKLISAMLVVIALLLPKWKLFKKFNRRRGGGAAPLEHNPASAEGAEVSASTTEEAVQR